MIPGFGRAAVSTALDIIKVSRSYLRSRARTLAIATTSTFLAVEAVGNLVPTAISLATTRTLPTHEALLTQALFATFAAILVEHLVAITLLTLVYYQALSQIATEVGRRNFPPRETDHYLPPPLLRRATDVTQREVKRHVKVSAHQGHPAATFSGAAGPLGSSRRTPGASLSMRSPDEIARCDPGILLPWRYPRLPSNRTVASH